MEPMMVIVLLAIGLAGFCAVQTLGMRKRLKAEDKVMKGYFLLALSALMAKLAQADGNVSADETALAMTFFSGMNMTDAEKAICIGNFTTARRDGLTVRDHARRFLAYGDRVACEFLYDLLWRISRTDGTVDPAEDKLLAEVAECLGLGKEVYERFRAGEVGHFDADLLLAGGVPASLVDVDVR